MKDHRLAVGRAFLLATLLALVPAIPALAHSGGLDAYGYHRDRLLGRLSTGRSPSWSFGALSSSSRIKHSTSFLCS